MWFLAGLPGKLKVLVDRLTATRAANLDNLNATVSSRAPASTALSNAVWTDARAAKLDNAEQVVGVTTGTWGVSFSSVRPLHYHTLTRVTSTSWTTVLNVSGRGVLQVLAGAYVIDSINSRWSAVVRLTIDGVVRYTSPVVTEGGQGVYYNYIAGSPYCPEALPFKSSLKIECYQGLSGSASTPIDSDSASVLYAYKILE